MKEFSQILIEKKEVILDNWVEAVRRDRRIESANDLSRPAIEDHISLLLSALATVLSQYQKSEIEPVVNASEYHGLLRAKQGFDPEELAREYRLLRQVIFSVLQANLLSGTAAEGIRAVRLIDTVIDEAIAQCFKTYFEERLREIQKIQRQLTLTNQELTRLAAAHQENLSLLAHEFKTPLNSIIGYSEMFLRQEQRSSMQKQTIPEKDHLAKIEHIERVLRNGRQLLRLVNDTLEISRADNGKIQLRLMSTDVSAAINSVVEVLEPLAQQKDLKLLIDCHLAPKRIVTDPLRFQQIVTNLVSNAIRYTQTGTIQVIGDLKGDRWTLSVSDTGRGIAEADQKRIFEPFFRAGGEQSQLADSTGLGLAIVSRLVKLLQGTIELTSQVGVGSTFTVTLPLEIQNHISKSDRNVGIAHP